MTFWDLLLACRRRWVVVIVGVLLTAGGLVMVERADGVYWAQSNVIFLAPTSSRFPNSLNTGSESLIMTAGIVANVVHGDQDVTATSSSSVSIVDMGIEDGTLIRLPSVGGQWAKNFSQPVLDVEAAAATPEEVQGKMSALLSAINTTLAQMQDQAGVDEFNRMTTQASPSSIDVQYRQGDKRRALLMTLTLGVVATLGAVVAADRHARRTSVPFRKSDGGRARPGAGPPRTVSNPAGARRSNDRTKVGTSK